MKFSLSLKTLNNTYALYTHLGCCSIVYKHAHFTPSNFFWCVLVLGIFFMNFFPSPFPSKRRGGGLVFPFCFRKTRFSISILFWNVKERKKTNETKKKGKKESNKAGYTAQDAPSTCLKITRDGRTYGRTDRRTDGRTDGRTHPLIEMRRRI